MKSVRPKFLSSLIALLTCIAFYRLWTFVGTYSVNVLYWDQWDFFNPLFENESLWEKFSFQHGPHRQGLGAFVIEVIASLSSWDNQIQSYAVAVLMGLASVLALFLKRRLVGRWSLFDVVIPLMFMSFMHYEMLVVVPNPAHGSLPLVFSLVLAFLLIREPSRGTLFLFCLLAFFSIFTGFALFLGVVCFGILFRDILFGHLVRESSFRGLGFLNLGLAMAFVLGSWWLFFQQYANQPAANCFQFPHSAPLEYFPFLATAFASFFGLGGTGTLGYGVGMASLCAILGVTLWSYWPPFRDPNLSREEFYIRQVCGCLGMFTLLFFINTAVGRVCLGEGAASASRYMPYAIPGVLALYIYFSWAVASKEGVTRLLRYLFPSVLTVLVCVNEFLLLPDRFESIKPSIQSRKHWARCFRKRGDIDFCTQKANFSVYPAPEATRLTEKLEYLENNRLNLFKQRKKAGKAHSLPK